MKFAIFLLCGPARLFGPARGLCARHGLVPPGGIWPLQKIHRRAPHSAAVPRDLNMVH
jgi:hypothetical protein